MPDKDDTGAEIVHFPQTRVRPSGAAETPADLGPSGLAKRLGAPREQKTGHWCSRCRGIWYGYLLEVTCPVCGSRHG